MDTNRSNTDDAAGSKTVADVLRLSCELAEEARDRQVSGSGMGFKWTIVLMSCGAVR